MKAHDLVIQEFVARLAKVKGASLQIICWPDKVNRSKPDIDAIAEGNGYRIAIEHTTIDAVLRQREDSARLKKVFGELRAQLNTTVADRIRLTVDFYSVPNKTSWQKLQQTLKKWLQEKIPILPYGAAYHDIPGIPFRVHINKRASKKPNFQVGRFIPLDKSLIDRMAALIAEKSQKLVPYKKDGFKTILLIENEDIALMRVELMDSSVKAAMKKLQITLDEIWYADTSIPNNLEFWAVWSKNGST